MTLDEFKKDQRRALKDAKKLAKTDSERARSEAMERLQAAKIITKSGNLTSYYR